MIPKLDTNDLIGSCDAYLGARTGKYEWRRIRYRAALLAMQATGATWDERSWRMDVGLKDEDTVVDVGAGWTEFDYCLRTEGHWRGRYIPVDGCVDGTDLEEWTPPRPAEWFVALELLEHLEDPGRLVRAMQAKATKGIIVSTPNPMTTDVLGMDPTHKTEIHQRMLREWGFQHVLKKSFYGGKKDSLFALWALNPPEAKRLAYHMKKPFA